MVGSSNNASMSDGPTRSTPQAKVSGLRSQSSEDSVAAIRNPEDPDLFSLSDLLAGPVDCVEQIILHLLAHFTVTPRQGIAARSPWIPGNSPPTHRVSTVREPLSIRSEYI